MELPPGLDKFLKRLDDYSSTIPDELVKYHLKKNGEDCDDPRLIRTISVATQFFTAYLLHDALQLAKKRREAAERVVRARRGPVGEQGFSSADRRLVLTAEDVCEVLLDEHGIDEKRPMYVIGRAPSRQPDS